MKNLKYFLTFICLFMLAAGSFARKGVIYMQPGSIGDPFSCDPRLNRDDAHRPFIDMKLALERLGYEVRLTKNLLGLDDAYRIICCEVPLSALRALKRYPQEKLILFLFEPPTAKPFNYEKRYHDIFSRVYTWKDDLVDNRRYFKFFDPTPSLDFVEPIIPFQQKRLSVFLTYNKCYKHPLSLSSERKKIIKFFEPFDEQEFDLFGSGWSKGFSKNYKGFVTSKVECMRNYKFCFCYENMRDIEGYITGEVVPLKHGREKKTLQAMKKIVR